MDLSQLLQIPDIFSMKTILVIQPHADDAEIGVGGTLARVIADGARVDYVTVADDRVGSRDRSIYPEQLAELRIKEQDAAMEVLGINSNRWLGWRDSEVLPTHTLRGQFIRAIRELKPDAVMTIDPWLPYEAHPDHRYTGMIAAEAAFLAAQPYVNPEHLRDGLEPHEVTAVAFMGTSKPNVFISIDNTIETKLTAVRCHKSQFEHTWDFYESYLTYLAKQWAQQAQKEGYMEAFKVLTPLQMHYNVHAESM